MPDRSDFWYRLGYALETARQGRTRAALDGFGARAVARPRKDAPSTRSEPEADEGAGSGALDLLLAAGTGTLVSRLLRAWPARRSGPNLARLLRAGAAGAAATFLRELLDPLLRGDPRIPTWDEGLGDRLTAGVARGLIYGAVLDTRLPGPSLARGVAYGTTEYLLSPWGGLRRTLGKSVPYARLPVLSGLLDDPEAGEEAFVDHLVFGVALALLYGTEDETRIGIGDDDR
jgi:hypothetical protein